MAETESDTSEILSDADAERAEAEKAKRAAQRRPSVEIKIKLVRPIQLGKESIEELTLKPQTRAFKDLELPLREDKVLMFQPYPLALVGLGMAGYALAAKKILDGNLMDPRDMRTVADAVFDFLG